LIDEVHKKVALWLARTFNANITIFNSTQMSRRRGEEEKIKELGVMNVGFGLIGT